MKEIIIDSDDNIDIKPYEEEKEFQRAYIENMYRYFGYGLWLVFSKETGELIGRAGLEHREYHEETELERAARIAKEMRTDGRLGAKDGYVSKFEDIAGNNTNQLDTPVRSRKRFDDKEERRRPTYDLSNKDYGMKPIYTEEELEKEDFEIHQRNWQVVHIDQ